MEAFQHLMLGFGICFQPINLLVCFIGVLVGTLVGVLPGIGPVAAISLVLPATFKITPVQSLIMLAGIYYGAMYGGSTTSILVNVPGEAASVVTCLDGYQMARQGRAGPALGIAAFGSFIAGTFGVIGLVFLAPPLAEIALKFGPPEYFSLVILGVTLVSYLGGGSLIKDLMMATVGLLLASIGTDIMTGAQRFTFGVIEIAEGWGLVPVVMGLFGISEVLVNIEQELKTSSIVEGKIKNLLPNLKDWRDSKWPIIRGSILGFFIGILPGGGALISSFASYAIEKKVSKHPEKFGKGAIEGVAGPESANNSAAQAAFIPLLTLGIPANAVMAILLGALMIHGITPGPLLMEKYPDLFWGTIASMYVGNGMLLILNLPLIGIWVQILKVPYPILFPLILLFCLIGSYSINNMVMDVLVMVVFGLVGYLMKKTNFSGAPLILAFVLGPMLEDNLRRSLIMSYGHFNIFYTRPISAIFIITALIILVSSIIKIKGRKVIPIPPKSEDD